MFPGAGADAWQFRSRKQMDFLSWLLGVNWRTLRSVEATTVNVNNTSTYARLCMCKPVYVHRDSKLSAFHIEGDECWHLLTYAFL